MKGRIVIITGSPGTGKTTVSGILAEISDYPRTIHLHTDDFYHYLRKGFIPPQLPESNEQNRVVVEAILRACQCFADNGYKNVAKNPLACRWDESNRFRM